MRLHVQDAEAQRQYNAKSDTITSENMYPMAIDNNNIKIYHFLPGPNQDADRKASAKVTDQLQKEYKDIFTGKGCFNGIFPLQVKPNSKQYQEL